MARFNEILSGRFNRALQKALSMKGGPPAAQLSSEIQPNLQFLSGTENRYLESWNMFGSAGGFGFVAGQVNGWQLKNPAASNVIGVVEKLLIAESVSEAFPNFLLITMDTNKAAFSAAVGARCLDNRPVKGSATTLGANLQASTQVNTAATGGVIAALPLQANIIFPFITTDDQEIPLLPGDSLVVTTGAVSSVLYVSVQWRERFLEDSERF